MTGTRSTLWEPGRTCASAGGKPRAPRFSPSTPKRTPPEGGSPISTGFGSGPPSIELRLEVEVEGLAIRIIRCGPGIAVPGRAADDRRAPAEDVVDSSRELEVVTDVPRQSEVEVARGRQLRVGQRVQRRHGRRVGPQRQQVFVDRDRVDESPAHRHIDGAVDPADARDPLDPGYGLAAGRAIGAGALLPVVRQLLDRDDRVLALPCPIRRHLERAVGVEEAPGEAMAPDTVEIHALDLQCAGVGLADIDVDDLSGVRISLNGLAVRAARTLNRVIAAAQHTGNAAA